MDTMKSDRSSEKASSVGRRSLGLDGKFNPSTLRGKLIDIHHLDQEEVNQIVANMGKGCAIANISKLSKSTMDSIKQVEFVDPKKGNKDATRMQVGRAIYEFAVNMIIPCGEAFVLAVKYNVDIASELDNVSKQKVLKSQLGNRTHISNNVINRCSMSNRIPQLHGLAVLLEVQQRRGQMVLQGHLQVQVQIESRGKNQWSLLVTRRSCKLSLRRRA